MKTDHQLKTEVIDELDWDPAVNATHVGVAVRDGAVTLSGHLDTLAERYAAERAVLRVQGVKGIALDLDVKLDPRHQRSDAEIAAAAEAAFRWHALVPADRICVKVESGRITLGGEVDWEYQRHEAEQAVRTLTGVTGITNAITLKALPTPADVSSRIRDALVRQAQKDATEIEVSVAGSAITLRGKVHSWSERGAASSAA
jgi:osmotically-inducible protein OsmY